MKALHGSVAAALEAPLGGSVHPGFAGYSRRSCVFLIWRGLIYYGIPTLRGLIKRDVRHPEFFHSTYGFEFVHNIHGGPLDVLVHRMRKAITLYGDIDRDDDRITLRLRSEVAIPDPRCCTPIDTRLVRLLSQMGPLSTDAAASELGLPVRTARALLRQFVADGLCRELREGRSVRYQIEDTTFNEPTPVGMET